MSERELEVAVAKAMGCTAYCCYDGLWELRGPDGKESRPLFHTEAEAWESCPHYSEDRGRLVEMLEWAASQALMPVVKQGEFQWVAELWIDTTDSWVGECGDTPQLALAKAIASLAP